MNQGNLLPGWPWPGVPLRGRTPEGLVKAGFLEAAMAAEDEKASCYNSVCQKLPSHRCIHISISMHLYIYINTYLQYPGSLDIFKFNLCIDCNGLTYSSCGTETSYQLWGSWLSPVVFVGFVASCAGLVRLVVWLLCFSFWCLSMFCEVKIKPAHAPKKKKNEVACEETCTGTGEKHIISNDYGSNPK